MSAILVRSIAIFTTVIAACVYVQARALENGWPFWQRFAASTLVGTSVCAAMFYAIKRFG